MANTDKRKALRSWAYTMGMDCGLHGPNGLNCHYTIFATADMTADWERGKADAIALLTGQVPQ